VDVVQGNAPGGMIVTLYFDQKTGLLVRAVRYTASPVGKIPVQADFGDYREVAGVKIPHSFTLTWLDGRDTFELSSVRANVAIDAARFAKPAPSTPRGAGR
jgi:outer membrane lipoprotein-sorting protein